MEHKKLYFRLTDYMVSSSTNAIFSKKKIEIVLLTCSLIWKNRRTKIPPLGARGLFPSPPTTSHLQNSDPPHQVNH